MRLGRYVGLWSSSASGAHDQAEYALEKNFTENAQKSQSVIFIEKFEKLNFSELEKFQQNILRKVFMSFLLEIFIFMFFRSSLF